MDFPLGSWVKIKGLVKATYLNSLYAEIVSCDEHEDGRLAVLPIGNSAKLIKPTNVEAIDFDEALKAVRLHADGESGSLSAVDLPKEIFLHTEEVKPCKIAGLLGIPLVLIRATSISNLVSEVDYRNNNAAHLMRNPTDGTIPNEYTSFFGPAHVYRCDAAPLDIKTIVHMIEFIANIIDDYPPPYDEAVMNEFTPSSFKVFCDSCTGTPSFGQSDDEGSDDCRPIGRTISLNLEQLLQT